MSKIFISYRREDSQWPADRLYETLKKHVPNPDTDVFIDVDDIPLGIDFQEHLDAKVKQCDVLIALIGDRWLETKDPNTGTPRLDNPADFVRIEIGAALKRGIPVVPVMLDGANIPSSEELPEDLKSLASRNGVEIRRLSFDADTSRLIEGLGLTEQPGDSGDQPVVEIRLQDSTSQQSEPIPEIAEIAASTTNTSSTGKFSSLVMRMVWPSTVLSVLLLLALVNNITLPFFMMALPMVFLFTTAVAGRAMSAYGSHYGLVSFLAVLSSIAALILLAVTDPPTEISNAIAVLMPAIMVVIIGFVGKKLRKKRCE